MGGGQAIGRGEAQLHQHRAGRDLGRDRRGARLAAALRAARGLPPRHGADGRPVPHRRRRRAEGPDRGLDLGLGSWSGKLADRSHRHRRRSGTLGSVGDADGTARRDLATSVGRFPRPGEARHRHRLRKPGGLRLGAADGLGAGGRDQGCRRLQPGGAGRRADVRRCDGRRPQDPPRGEVVDGRRRHLQERDLPVSQAVAAGRRRRTLARRLCPPAARRRRRMGEAAGRPSSW